MDKFLTWLAVSPLGRAGKIGAAAFLGYVVANANDFHPALAVVITASLPVIIDALNKEDVAFGIRDGELFEDEDV